MDTPTPRAPAPPHHPPRHLRHLPHHQPHHLHHHLHLCLPPLLHLEATPKVAQAQEGTATAMANSPTGTEATEAHGHAPCARITTAFSLSRNVSTATCAAPHEATRLAHLHPLQSLLALPCTLYCPLPQLHPYWPRGHLCSQPYLLHLPPMQPPILTSSCKQRHTLSLKKKSTSMA